MWAWVISTLRIRPALEHARARQRPTDPTRRETGADRQNVLSLQAQVTMGEREAFLTALHPMRYDIGPDLENKIMQSYDEQGRSLVPACGPGRSQSQRRQLQHAH